MATAYREKSRNGWRAQVFVRGKLRKLWLGPISASGCKLICQHLDALKHAAEAAVPASANSLKWARSTDERIQKQLAKWGLIELGSTESLPKLVGAYAERYRDAVSGANSTKKRWKNTVSKLLQFFPPHVSLSAVSPGDAERVAKSIRSQFSSSHAGKLLSDFKQIFAAGGKDRLITENPFEHINTKGQHDKARETYVEAATINKLLEHCDTHFAAIITLARFAGLRVPSEPLALELSHLDLPAGKMSIWSPKTGFRVCPIFPECRPHLEKLWDQAAEGQKHLFTRARSSAATVWRDKLLSVCQAASVKPWPKLWQNLRASARTDLESRFPAFVCDSWLGHSSRIAAKHYSRVNDQHFAEACGVVPAECGVVGGVVQPTAGRKKPQKNKPKLQRPTAKTNKKP